MATQTRDPFISFVLAAAVACVGVAGTLFVTKYSEDRETLRQMSIVSTKVDILSAQLAKVNEGIPVIINLGIRVDMIEKSLVRQESILEELQNSRVPKIMRELKDRS